MCWRNLSSFRRDCLTFDKTFIFSDGKIAIATIIVSTPEPGDDYITQQEAKSGGVAYGVIEGIGLPWIPGHIRIEGNVTMNYQTNEGRSG